MEVERTIGVLDDKDESLAYIVKVMVPCDPSDHYRPHYPINCRVNGVELIFHRYNPKTNNAIYRIKD